MKKIIALALALMLAFSCAAFAEEVVVEISYDGVWAEMEYGLGLYVPADWYVAELTEEQMELGMFAFFVNEDATQSLQIAAVALNEGDTLESLGEGLAEVYSDVAIAELPNGNFLTYADYEAGLFSCLSIDEEAGVLYSLNFGPFSEEFAALATEIVCTFGYIAYEE